MHTKVFWTGIVIMVVGGLAPNIYGLFVHKDYLLLSFVLNGLGSMIAVSQPLLAMAKFIKHYND